MRWLLLLFCFLPMADGWALRVVQGADGLEVRGKGPVAAFMPTARDLWVVAPEDGREQHESRNGWQVSNLNTQGSGVRLQSPAARTWEVVRDGEAFVVKVRPEGGWRQPLGGKQSVVVLRDGTVAGEAKGFPASSEDGLRYEVFPDGYWQVGPGIRRVLAGGVVASPQNLALGLAGIEPAAGADVPFEAAEALPRVASPLGGMAMEEEDLAQAGPRKVVVQGVVYTPGELLVFTLPEGYRWVDGTLVHEGDVDAVTSLLAVEEAAMKVASLDSDVPEQAGKAKKSEVEEGSAGTVQQEAQGPEPDVSVAYEESWLPQAAGDFKLLEAEQLAKVVATDDPASANTERRHLARLYLAWQRPEEALGVMALVTPTLPMDRLLSGVAEVARNKPQQAEVALKGLEGAWKGHADLWRATAAQMAGASARAVRLWPKERGIVPAYPAWLRDLALRQRAEALLAVAPRQEAAAFVRAVVEDMRGEVSPAWQRLQGLSMLGGRQEREALEMLAAAAEQTRDPITAYHAKYDFVNALAGRGELESRQMIVYLEDLRLDWRGGELEQRVLRDLGRIHTKRGEYRDALQRWQTLVRAYPQYPGMAQLTQDMTGAVLGVFDPENPVGYSPLEFMGLFFDFRELLPADARGDRITERVGLLLSEATLYERAVPLLQDLLRYREQEAPIDRARIALLLARSLRLSGAPQDSLRLLDEYDKDVTNSLLREAWQVEEANVLLALERYKEAIDAVGTLRKPEADRVRLDGYWALQDWPNVRAFARKVLDERDTRRNDQLFRVAILRAGMAEMMLGEGGNIPELQKDFADVLESMPEVSDSLRAMAGMQGITLDADASNRALGTFANTLAQVNQLIDRMASLRIYQNQLQEEQDEYNEKMQYMELLPPPAL